MATERELEMIDMFWKNTLKGYSFLCGGDKSKLLVVSINNSQCLFYISNAVYIIDPFVKWRHTYGWRIFSLSVSLLDWKKENPLNNKILNTTLHTSQDDMLKIRNCFCIRMQNPQLLYFKVFLMNLQECKLIRVFIRRRKIKCPRNISS